MADAKRKGAFSTLWRWRRPLRLAGPCLAAFAVILSARGDSFVQGTDVGSREFLNSIAASEGYCYAHYGRGGEAILPQCPQRAGACMGFQHAARDRLNAQWDGLSARVRRRCVREAQDAFRDDQNDPAVRARVSHGGYWRGFAHDAVERCVARQLARPAPPSWSAQPAPAICRASADNPLPAEAGFTPEAICNDIFASRPFEVERCIAEESAAQARLRPRWRSLSPAMVSLCSSEIRAPWTSAPGDQRPRDGWRYTHFEACLARIGS